MKQGKYCPVLTCDTCGYPIESLEKSMACYRCTVGQEFFPVQIYHKITCDPESPYHPNGRKLLFLSWSQLDEYIPHLLWNHNWGTRLATHEGYKLTIDVPRPIVF